MAHEQTAAVHKMWADALVVRPYPRMSGSGGETQGTLKG